MLWKWKNGDRVGRAAFVKEGGRTGACMGAGSRSSQDALSAPLARALIPQIPGPHPLLPIHGSLAHVSVAISASQDLVCLVGRVHCLLRQPLHIHAFLHILPGLQPSNGTSSVRI